MFSQKPNQYQLFRTSHPVNIAAFKKNPFAHCLLSLDYRDHTFKSGESMKDIFDGLQRNYGYNTSQIDQLKKDCKLEIWIVDLAKKCAYIQASKSNAAKL